MAKFLSSKVRSLSAIFAMPLGSMQDTHRHTQKTACQTHIHCSCQIVLPIWKCYLHSNSLCFKHIF